MKRWLFKSEPNVFGIDHLYIKPNRQEHWDGVRNYQVRNMLRDEIKKGDLAFFYHSNCTPPGIAGIIKIISSGYPDYTAWDLSSNHFDTKSSPENPRWYMVDVEFQEKFPRIVTLEEIKQHPLLNKMRVAQTGNRLSITPISAEEWQTIIALAHN